MASGTRAQYRLATYQTKEGPRAGLIVGDDVFDVHKIEPRVDVSRYFALSKIHDNSAWAGT